jgi:hypothetical protein
MRGTRDGYMTTEKKQKTRRNQGHGTGGGGKLARSETVTVRLDQRLRYLAELAARKQRRTLSSFIEWSVEEALKHLTLGGFPGGPAGSSIEYEASTLWDIDEADRFVRLAVSHPELLTYDEQIVRKLLNDSLLLFPAYRLDSCLNWEIIEEYVLPVVRDYWPDVVMAALGSSSEQRQWVERTRLDVANGKVYPQQIVATKSGGDAPDEAS